MLTDYELISVLLTDFTFNLVLLGVGTTAIFGLFTRLLKTLYNED